MRLNIDTWKNIFRNLEEIGEEVEVVWLDAVPYDKNGKPTGEVNEWVLCNETELFEDGFKTEQEANERLRHLESIIL